jgi:hypothetical protein
MDNDIIKKGTKNTNIYYLVSLNLPSTKRLFTHVEKKSRRFPKVTVHGTDA